MTAQKSRLKRRQGKIFQEISECGRIKGSVIRGMAVTDCHYMMLENDSFEGKECEIKYTFVGEKMYSGRSDKRQF